MAHPRSLGGVGRFAKANQKTWREVKQVLEGDLAYTLQTRATPFSFLTGPSDRHGPSMGRGFGRHAKIGVEKQRVQVPSDDRGCSVQVRVGRTAQG